MSTLSERFDMIRERIQRACEANNRDPGSVRLLPVTKKVPISTIRDAVSLGLTECGESLVQEASRKAQELADVGPHMRWVMIGHLQTNKAKTLAGFAHEYQGVDSVRIAQALNRHLETIGRTMPVLVQINTSGEHTKSGLPADADHVRELLMRLKNLPHLQVTGFMTIGANSRDESVVRDSFRRLRQLRDQLRHDTTLGLDLPELSMGMSRDCELAIAEGSTTVRVGQALFGSRTPAF